MEKAKDAGIVGILVGTLGLGMYDDEKEAFGHCTQMVNVWTIMLYNVLWDQRLRACLD